VPTLLLLRKITVYGVLFRKNMMLMPRITTIATIPTIVHNHQEWIGVVEVGVFVVVVVVVVVLTP